MTLRNLYLLVVGVFWFLWLGLLTCASWVVCEKWLSESWNVWLLQHARYAHARCLACCKEGNT